MPGHRLNRYCSLCHSILTITLLNIQYYFIVSCMKLWLEALCHSREKSRESQIRSQRVFLQSHALTHTLSFQIKGGNGSEKVLDVEAST